MRNRSDIVSMYSSLPFPALFALEQMARQKPPKSIDRHNYPFVSFSRCRDHNLNRLNSDEIASLFPVGLLTQEYAEELQECVKEAATDVKTRLASYWDMPFPAFATIPGSWLDKDFSLTWDDLFPSVPTGLAFDKEDMKIKAKLEKAKGKKYFFAWQNVDWLHDLKMPNIPHTIRGDLRSTYNYQFGSYSAKIQETMNGSDIPLIGFIDHVIGSGCFMSGFDSFLVMVYILKPGWAPARNFALWGDESQRWYNPLIKPTHRMYPFGKSVQGSVRRIMPDGRSLVSLNSSLQHDEQIAVSIYHPGSNSMTRHTDFLTLRQLGLEGETFLTDKHLLNRTSKHLLNRTAKYFCDEVNRPESKWLFNLGGPKVLLKGSQEEVDYPKSLRSAETRIITANALLAMV